MGVLSRPINLQRSAHAMKTLFEVTKANELFKTEMEKTKLKPKMKLKICTQR